MRTKLSEEEKQFVREEAQNAGQGYTYRFKVLFGEYVVLKEKNGKPITKWAFDSSEAAIKIAEKLNKEQDKAAEFQKSDKYKSVYKICTGKKCKDKKNVGNPVTEQTVDSVVYILDGIEKENLSAEESDKEIKKQFKILEDYNNLNKDLLITIKNLRHKGLTAHEIWEEIELDEAIKKLPGREIKVKDSIGSKEISKIEKAGKLRPLLYWIYFKHDDNRQLISKKELIELWTTGDNGVDMKLLPEKPSLKQSFIESLELDTIFIEVQKNEFSVLFKKISDHFKEGKKETMADEIKWLKEYNKVSSIDQFQSIKDSVVNKQNQLHELIKVARKLNYKK